MKRILTTLAAPLALLLGWWVILGLLVVKTANQPHISERQLGMAKRVIVGIARPAAGLQKSGPGRTEPTHVRFTVQVEEIALERADVTPFESSVPVPESIEFDYPGDQSLPPIPILVPLAFVGGSWQAADVRIRFGPDPVDRMFVYPDSESVRERCSAIWARQLVGTSTSSGQDSPPAE